MENSAAVTLSTVSQIVSSLRSVVATFYGPQCSQTLLTSQTGKAVVTSDGYTIVEALSPDHPVAGLVFQALKRCHTHTLDGSKVFLIYLDHILKELLHAIEQGKFDHSGVSRAGRKDEFDRHGAVCARQQLHKLMSEVMPSIHKHIIRHGQHLSNNVLKNKIFQQTILGVCKTALMPQYSPKVCEFFAKTLIASLPSEFTEEFLDSLNIVTDKFYSLSIKVCNRPYGESTVYKPFLIKRKMTVKCKGLGSSPINAVILTSSLDGTKSDEHRKEIFHVKQGGQITKLLLNRQRAVETFARACRTCEVSLLLCTENIPPYAADIFHRNGISVISFVYEEDVQVIETLTKKLALQSMHDEIAVSNTIPLRSVTEVTIGGEMYVQLNVGDISWRHLIICGPTVGLCDQAAMMCHKALCALRHCFMSVEELGRHKIDEFQSESTYDGFNEVRSDVVDQDKSEGEWVNENEGAGVDGGANIDDSIAHDCGDTDNYNHDKVNKNTKESETYKRLDHEKFDADNKKCTVNKAKTQSVTNKMVFIEGGGSLEILVSHLLQNYLSDCKDPNLTVMCHVVRQALINAVNVLFSNTIKTSGHSRQFTEVLTVMDKKFIDEGELWGLDRRGKPRDLAEQCVFEPVRSKMHILECVLSLVDQLLGLDQIVSVKKLKDDVDSDDYDNEK